MGLAYYIVKGIMAVGSWVFFKRVQFVGLDKIPKDGPVILCANHTNGLADPILMTSHVPRIVRYMMKDTLNDNPVLALFAWMMHTVPIMRRQDHDDKRARAVNNTEAFTVLFSVLEQGGCVGIFPEGYSYIESHLQEIKPGLARIALGAADTKGLRVPIMALGFTYLHKKSCVHEDGYLHRYGYRKQVLIEVGDPFYVTQEQLDLYRRDPRAGIAQFNEKVESEISKVTVSTPDWNVHRTLQTARRIYTPTWACEAITLYHWALLTRRSVEIFDQLVELGSGDCELAGGSTTISVGSLGQDLNADEHSGFDDDVDVAVEESEGNSSREAERKRKRARSSSEMSNVLPSTPLSQRARGPFNNIVDQPAQSEYTFPREYAALWGELERYQCKLRALHMKDEELQYHDIGIIAGVALLLGMIFYLLVLLPITLPGAIIGVPNMSMGWLAGHMAVRAGKWDVVSTYEAIVGFFSFTLIFMPIFIVGISLVCAFVVPGMVWWGYILIALGVPLSYLASVVLIEEMIAAVRTIRTVLRLAFFRKEVKELRIFRRELQPPLAALADKYTPADAARLFPHGPNTSDSYALRLRAIGKVPLSSMAAAPRAPPSESTPLV